MAELQQAASLCAGVVPRSVQRYCPARSERHAPLEARHTPRPSVWVPLARVCRTHSLGWQIPTRPSGTYPPRRAGRTGSKYAKIIQLYLGMAYELRKPAMQICFDIIYRLKFVHRPLLAGETLSYSVKFGLLPAPSLVGRQRNYPERLN